MARKRRPLFWLFLVPLLLATAAAHADTITFTPKTFSARAQSMWGPGGAKPSATTYTLVDPNTFNWNYQTSGYPGYIGPFTTVDTYFWGDASFGLRGRAKTEGRLGLWAIVTIDTPGEVNVDYTVVPTLTFPDENSFRAGDTVVIGSSYTVQGGSLATKSPAVELELQGEFKFIADLYGEACVVACLKTSDVISGLSSPLVNQDPGRFQILELKKDSSYQTPGWMGEFTPFSASIRVPRVDVTAAPGNDGTMRGSASDPFVTVSLNLTDVASMLFGIKAPLSFNTDDFSDHLETNVKFRYTIVDSLANARLKVAQSFSFDPDLKVTLQFPRELEYRVESGGSTGAAARGTSATMRVGDKLHLVTPSDTKQPTEVSSAFRLDNQFQSQTGFLLGEDITLTAGDLGFQFPELEIVPRLCTPGFCTPAVKAWGVTIIPEVCVPEICTPSVSVPAINFDIKDHVAALPYEKTFNLAEQNLGTIFSESWQLGGFTEISAESPLSIDPENPIVSISQITGATANLGGGRRRVAYAIDLTNPGDVELSKLSIRTNLAAAFGPSRGYTVEKTAGCDLDVNPDFNGSGNQELLLDGNTLPVGDTKRVVLFVVVSPQPDPNPYVSASNTEGRSPIDTLVRGSDDSSVLLGPGVVTGTSDFVLYGEHFVKLDSIANTFGHVGSNDMIEVKNGRSGVVAGDLRAGRFMKVHGEIAADYAFSGGIVDVVGKAKLTLSGNAKPFSALPALSMSLSPFSPGSALLGDVWVPNGFVQALQPGSYGRVTVNTAGTLVVNPGTYFIRDLSALTGASVQIRPPVTINVADNLTVGAGTAFGGIGSTREVTINAYQTHAIETGAGATIRGILNAPRANIMFGPAASIYGSAYGKSITLAPGASATYHQDCDRAIDGNCDGHPDCN